MGRALELARSGLGSTWPNPSVGCVVVNDGDVVGEGVTAPGGRPHAEPQALAAAGPRARGATVYVSLEPCNHYGVTPPCALALVEAEVGRVVVGLRDPDPRVDGAGTDRIKTAGIPVTTGVREGEARTVVAGFLHRLAHGRPLVEVVPGTDIPAGFDARLVTTAPSTPLPPPGESFRCAVLSGTDPVGFLATLGQHGVTRVAVAPSDPFALALRTAGMLEAD